MRRKAVVVGGGIAGLSAAYELSRGGAVDVALLEASSRVGGRVMSETVAGVPLEAGPDSFVTNKPWGVELARELGLERELLRTDEKDRSVYVYSRGMLRRYPEGMVLLGPSRIWPFLASDFAPPRAKLRMALELLVPRGDPGQDESLAQFTRRRFGAEALETIVGPVLAGIHAGDPEKLSLQSTFPMLKDLEQRHGSVAKAFRARRPGAPGGNGALTLFVAFRGGLDRLAAGLSSRLPSGAVRLNAELRSMELREGARYLLRTVSGDALEADAVVLALPSDRAARIEGLDLALAKELEGIEYRSTAVVNLVYDSASLRNRPRGFGFVVDRRTELRLTGVTFTSAKFPGRTPEGKTALRCYLGGAGRESVVRASDSDILGMCREELERLLRLGAEPLEARVSRWPSGSAQYNVGHAARLERIETILKKHPGLILAGGSYRGVGIPECIRSGREAARLAGGAARGGVA